MAFLAKDCGNGKPNACNRLRDAALSPCFPGSTIFSKKIA